jgi:hypothetical protein
MLHRPKKEHKWKLWESREIQQRAMLAHYMLDGLIAQMSGEPTSVRHASNQMRLLCNESAPKSRISKRGNYKGTFGTILISRKSNCGQFFNCLRALRITQIKLANLPIQSCAYTICAYSLGGHP